MREKKWKVTFTPNRPALTFEYSEQTMSEPFVRALSARLAPTGRPLTEKEDGDWLKGVSVYFGLRYANDLLVLVQQNRTVDMTVDTIIEDINAR